MSIHHYWKVNMFKLSKRSMSNLNNVHEHLVKVVLRAIEITEIDFGVIQGLRTPTQQAENIINKATRTKISRHLTGHAVDLMAFSGGKSVWKPTSLYQQIAKAMKQAAQELGVKIKWGGDWITFKDYVHFELDSSIYPITDKKREEIITNVDKALSEMQDRRMP